jgi:hypothetical protein
VPNDRWSVPHEVHRATDLPVCIHRFVAKSGRFVTQARASVFEDWRVRASAALAMMLLAAYAVATVQWWGPAPALTAVALAGSDLDRSR